MIEDEELAGLSAQAGSVEILTQKIIDLAIERETDDNCSVISIQIKGFRYQTYEDAPRKEGNWLNFFRR